MSDVLAVGPHPDDIELGAGGTIALLAAAGRSVVLLDLTRGERATRGTPAMRAHEAEAAARALGAAGRESLDIPDGEVSRADPAQVRKLVAAVRAHRPRLVVAMHENDDHPDHVEGAALVERAVYLAGLRNYPERESGVHRVERILFAMGRRPFVPGLVVDVSAHYPAKRAALDAFASQFRREPGDPLATPISDPGFRERLEARDRHYGGMIGAAYGEPFLERGPAAIRDPEQLLPRRAP